MSAKNIPQAALITGSAVRIGQAIAISLARAGYDIALHYNRSKKEAEPFADQLNKMSIACKVFQADLSDPEPLGKLMAQRMSDVFCQGSAKGLIAALVAHEKLSQEDIEALKLLAQGKSTLISEQRKAGQK